MSKTVVVSALLALLFTTRLFADISPLGLQCTVAFTHFDRIENMSKSGEVTLSDIKHKPRGSIKFTQTEAYEFWVMAHGVQSTNDHAFINNFQVAIKHKESGLFMHALSDTSHSKNKPPLAASISLVNYHTGTMLENGELFFECKRRSPID
jgi:hypothetical protein